MAKCCLMVVFARMVLILQLFKALRKLILVAAKLVVVLPNNVQEFGVRVDPQSYGNSQFLLLILWVLGLILVR